MTLHEFLHVLRRRKWIVLQTLVLVVAVVVGISVREQPLYRSTARVLLNWQNLANQLTGVSSGFNPASQPDRAAQTQAAVARTTAVAARVLATVPRSGLGTGGFLGSSNVTPNPNADVLIFTVTSRNPELARRLVNAYALQYTIYRHELDNASILKARAGIKASLAQLAAQGDHTSQLHSDLVNQDQTLATMEALQTSNASVLQTAGGAGKIQPRTKRNALLGVIVGLVLGVAFAYLWETLDTSVRNADDIRKHLGGLPLLARLPPRPKRLDAENRLVTLAAPDSPEAEAFRMLRTNLEFVMLGRGLQTIMVTSAIEQEGKSTTVANLAVALARVGRRVVLIDLDLRRPRVDRFFKVDGPGVVQVALGHVDLDSALVPVELPGTHAGASFRSRLNGGGTGATSLVRGTLHVLPAGAFPPDRSAFFESQALEMILGFLRELADIVLVDAPPALQVGDAMALSRKVDGIVVLARVNRVRRPMLVELERLLAMTPAQAIGFVAAVTTSEVYEAAYGGYAVIEESDIVPAAETGSAAR